MGQDRFRIVARLIAQKRRPIRMLINILSGAKFSPVTDVDRNAARPVLFSTGEVIAWLLTIGTILVSSWQVSLLREQNSLIFKQLHAAEISHFRERRTQLLSFIYDTELGVPKYNQRTRAEAVVEFVTLERWKAEANLQSIKKNERPELSVAIYDYGINLERASLAGLALDRINFRDVILENTDLHNASLFGSDFAGATINQASFENADLTAANLAAISLVGANFTNANLESIKGWGGNVSIHLANIHGIRNAPNGFRDWAIKQGAVDEPNQIKWHELKKKIIKLPPAKPGVFLY